MTGCFARHQDEEVPQITIHLPFSELSLAVANQILASGLLLHDTSGIFNLFLVTVELGTRCRFKSTQRPLK